MYRTKLENQIIDINNDVAKKLANAELDSEEEAYAVADFQSDVASNYFSALQLSNLIPEFKRSELFIQLTMQFEALCKFSKYKWEIEHYTAGDWQKLAELKGVK